MVKPHERTGISTAEELTGEVFAIRRGQVYASIGSQEAGQANASTAGLSIDALKQRLGIDQLQQSIQSIADQLATI